MNRLSERPTDSVRRVVEKYGNTLFRLCVVMLTNRADAEDALQETVIKYYYKHPEFRDEEHEKAWLIKVATNQCKDIIRWRKKHFSVDIESIMDIPAEIEDNSITEALISLPEMYRVVLILHYVEGYTTKEIAKIIGRGQSAVKMRLQKGRRMLEEKYRKEYM